MFTGHLNQLAAQERIHDLQRSADDHKRARSSGNAASKTDGGDPRPRWRHLRRRPQFA